MSETQAEVPPGIDPTKTWRKVEQRLAAEEDARVRRNLHIVLEHMRAEAAADLDALMATVSEEAHYHAYGGPPESSPEGKDAVRDFYEGVIASGIGRLELDVDRLVADRECVVTEGVMRMAWPGVTLGAIGIEVDDPTADYLYETRMAVFWMFDAEGFLAAEDSYTASDGLAGIAARKLPQGWDLDG